ncbi:SWIM zinc finger domain-containing protein [Paenibacillus sp. NPDC058071]|uniref:SWIM zinc finger family protein n=1 Tax=Paenibacillus sp. NPDC058071 TaxID=3346326 RepID=UPI0036DC8517
MNINDFESSVDDLILKRGSHYFAEGYIAETKKQGANEYIFYIEGSERYEIFVRLDDDRNVESVSCDCPYELGPVCKHQAAALYKLREMLGGGNDSSAEKETDKRPELSELLKPLSKQQLIDIIVNAAEKDEVLGKSLYFKYAPGNHSDELNKYKKMMTAIVRKYKGRGGFINYYSVSSFADELEEILSISNEGDALLSANIAVELLKKAVDSFQYADDSGGHIGWLARNAVQRIRDIAEAIVGAEPQAREQLFLLLLKQSESSTFDGWEEFRFDLISLCALFADAEPLRNKLVSKLQQWVDDYSGKDSKYNREKPLELLLELIVQYGTEEEAERFMAENRSVSSIRKRMLTKYADLKQFDQVIELATEGEQQDRKFHGLVDDWKAFRYIAYKGLSMKEEQRILARELLLDGDYDYYEELKQLHTGDAAALYEEIKLELRNAGWGARSVYLKLIEEERDYPELLGYVKRNPIEVERYAALLSQQFKEEVTAIYASYILDTAGASMGRKDYKKVCAKLKSFKKVAGLEAQTEVIQTLRSQYPRRPALLEELDKL